MALGDSMRSMFSSLKRNEVDGGAIWLLPVDTDSGGFPFAKFKGAM